MESLRKFKRKFNQRKFTIAMVATVQEIQMINNRKVSIIFDEDNKPIVLIHDKSFKSDTKEDWDFVEDYLRG